MVSELDRVQRWKLIAGKGEKQMSKAKLRWLIIALCVVVIALVQSASKSKATISPASPAGFPNLDLKSEDGTLDSFGDGSVKFDKRVAELRKASSFTLTDILNGLKPKGDDVK